MRGSGMDSGLGRCAAGCRNTTGFDLHWAGMLLGSVSNTQPGTPALSPGDSDLRALSRGVVEGQHVRHLFEDLGSECIRIKVRSGTSVALANTAKFGP